MPDETINFTKEAFMSPVNLGFLILALVTALLLPGAAAANILLVFAAAAELLYLGILPRNERYKRVVRSRKVDERRKAPRDREVFRTLAKDDQKRYVRFRNMEKAIKDNYAKLPYSSQGLLDAHLKKLDGLLDAHLNLLQLKERYVQFARRTGENDIVNAITGLQNEMQADPPRVRAIKQRRLLILEKRLDRFKKAGENLAIIEAQLETIEDVTRYVYEQSLTMQNPEEVSFQLDTLMNEVEETQHSMEALDDTLGIDGLNELDLEAFETSSAGEIGRVEGRIDAGLMDDLDDILGDAANTEADLRRRQREG
ncbi:hypothetical protein B1759_12095 [Rubrivirga sp. SAORIC476]|uniref:hypothetical protein n=1 Tax=Rubrivirga sp. SAORIC476 TaxID=1961794 RepID=UPI000BA95DBD|nr:hypothetical protein [Rubrivirga sp. SAORIC476]MAQ92667.1 hypothetical protein [Rhodothermaceae bacterium]MBC14026.1 hypothetical protein [Rhodothermaceae bacterium]PAP79095.1 hypothetical protein B1759_12095 [Rubrivirga sp. SAORIC476]